MSINVNVTGNPISIKRGKMVAVDPDYARKEFEKRRRIRLEQVRQQSKDIAEDIRNKVRKEKSKQLSDIERKGEKELKKWQARKLLALQQQYEECLNNIGLGHIQAAMAEESECALELQKEKQDQAAVERGKRAAQRLQEKQEKDTLHKANLEQKKKISKAVEDTRSTMVAHLNKFKKPSKSPFKKKKRKKLSTDINISSRMSSDSASEDEVPTLLHLNTSDTDSSSNTTSSPRKGSIQKSAHPLPFTEDTGGTTTSFQSHIPQSFKKLDEDENLQIVHEFPATKKKPPLDAESQTAGVSYPVDTRISDRIKRRTILETNYNHYDNICDSHMPRTHHVVRGAPFEQVPKNLTQQLTSKVDIAPIKQKNNNKCNSKTKQEEIPSKPPVILQSTQNKVKKPLQSNSDNFNVSKVQYYDHKNRYIREYIPEHINVQRIPEENIEVCLSGDSEAEFMEKMHKRDQEAEIRGKRALEREKTQRNYKEMMKQLPILQKQERIASIPASKPTFHMSNDRLKEHERRKQNRMENAYEKLFPTSRIITIPSNTTKTSTNSNVLPYRTISLDESPPILNVASWDINEKIKPGTVVAPKHIESELLREATEKTLGETADPIKAAEQRKESLQQMLQRLTYHRDKLAKELALLPESSSLHKLADELSNIDKIIERGKNIEKTQSEKSTRRKRSRSKRKQHAGSSLEEQDETFKSHAHCTPESSSSSSSSPPVKVGSDGIKSKKQHKSRRPLRLVLQNTSTQTTPTVEAMKDSGSKQHPLSASATTKPSRISENDGKLKSCDCKDTTGHVSSDTCEIVIKITDDGKPQICVSPSKLKDKQIVVKTQTKEVAEPSRISDNSSATTLDKTEQPKQTAVGGKRDVKVKHGVPVKPKLKASLSWREFLSQNSTNSSTSYFSPPDFVAKPTTAPRVPHTHPNLHYTCPCAHINPQHPHAAQHSGKCHLSSMLKDKPQQGNIQSENSTASSNMLSGNRQIHPCLPRYITKLLTMSRKNVDDLTVSSVSEISTPSSSIINIQPNNPLEQFQNVMKLMNEINYSSDGNNIHYNTIGSLTVSSSSSSSSKIVNSTPINYADARQMGLDEYSSENYPGVLAVYNKLAENCAKKIENLAAMIEKVRLDKLSMLHNSQGSGSDKENSTRYMDLPVEFKKPEIMEEIKSASPSSSSEQEELDKLLLGIDYSFVERLKKMTPAEVMEQFPLNSDDNNTSEDSNGQEGNNTDKELLRRFKNLRHNKESEDNAPENKKSSGNNPQNVDAPPFVPFLSDIPRMPKLELSATKTNGNFYKNNEKSKPPTSKGLYVARRFNNDISLIPHELSTIVESESLLSTKLHQSGSQLSDVASNKEKQLKSELPKDQVDVTEQIQEIPVEINMPETSSSDSLPDILAELVKNAAIKSRSPQKHKSDSHKQIMPAELVSDSSTSELENMESVLKSLGMGWAVATLRKTQEALALTSSSSSIDISLKKDIKVTDSSNSTSEISIREILGKQFLKQLSTSNKRSDDSKGSSSFMKELQDISGIQGSGGSNEKTTGRTSTPIQSMRADDIPRDSSQPHILLTGESELSSVRAHSDENCDNNQFYSLEEFSKSKNDSKKE